MSRLNGYIMSKDKKIATVNNDIITEYDNELLPLYLKNKKDVVAWLSDRAIDSHRVNSRLLKKALRLSSNNDLETVLSVHGATITDTYWYKEKNSQLTYDEVRFKENMFDKLALYGDPDGFDYPSSSTPELTNIGSFEKCWRLIDNEWWLYKRGNDLQYFSELFIFHLGKNLGFDMAYYEMDDKYIRTRDFTNRATVNFEAIDGIMGDNENYNDNFNQLDKISKSIAAHYLQLIYLDTLCRSMDRHTKNYGILRDTETGEIISLAPNYDNNIALIANGYPSSADRTNDGFIKFFEEFMDTNAEAKRMFCEMEIPNVDEEMINSCLDAIPISVRRDFIIPFILNGQERITAIIHDDQEQDFIQKM